jgi:hypothetical protein
MLAFVISFSATAPGLVLPMTQPQIESPSLTPSHLSSAASNPGAKS